MSKDVQDLERDLGRPVPHDLGDPQERLLPQLVDLDPLEVVDSEEAGHKLVGLVVVGIALEGLGLGQDLAVDGEVVVLPDGGHEQVVADGEKGAAAAAAAVGGQRAQRPGDGAEPGEGRPEDGGRPAARDRGRALGVEEPAVHAAMVRDELRHGSNGVGDDNWTRLFFAYSSVHELRKG